MGNNRKFGLLVEMKSNIKQFQQGMSKAQGTLKKMTAQFGAMAKGMLAAFGIKAIAGFIKNIFNLYDVQNKAEAALLTALKGREDAQQRLIRQAQELQKATLYGDEETIQAQALLASMELEEEAIKRLTPLVQDLATMKGMKLAAAADLVAKSVGSSTNALSRYGIEITGAVGSSERLNSAVDALTIKFKGQAMAAAEAGSGGLQQLKMALDDVKETMGGVIIEATGVSVAASDLAAKIGEVDWDKVAEETAGFFERWSTSLKETYKWAKYLIPQLNNLMITVGLFKNALPTVEGESPDYNTERTSIKAGELPSVPGLPFMGPATGGAMTLEDTKELHEAFVIQQELLDKQAEYWQAFTSGVAGGNKEALEAVEMFIPALEEEGEVLDGTNEIVQNYLTGIEEMKEKTTMMAAAISGAIAGIGSAFRTMAEDGKMSMKGLMSVVIDTIAAMIQAYLALTIAKVIAKESEKGLFGLILAGIGVAAFTALWHSQVPEFAAGAIVSGETIARVGEYPGASTGNPEIIAPLNKLKGLLGGVGGGVVEFEIRGDKLVGVLNNYSQKRQLMR